MPSEDVAELALDAPRVGNLVADAVRLRDRIVGSRAYREQWLAGCVDDRELDAAVWQLTQTGLAVAAMMDAVCEAADHPELRERSVAGERDIAAAVRGLRVDLARMSRLADAAAAIDGALASAEENERRRGRRGRASEDLARRSAALAATRASHVLNADAATAVADYVGHETESQQDSYRVGCARLGIDARDEGWALWHTWDDQERAHTMVTTALETTRGLLDNWALGRDVHPVQPRRSQIRGVIRGWVGPISLSPSHASTKGLGGC